MATMKKSCLKCGQEFVKKRSISATTWKEKTTFCSKRCAYDNRIGQRHSDEHKKKIGLASIGNKFRIGISPWNKGLKGMQISSRKGIKLGTNPNTKGEKKPWFMGENNPRWIKDRSKLKKYIGSEERRSQNYKEWRKQVWLRDNFTCKIANPDCNGRIEAHHILSWRDHENIRYDVNNGITLCHFHHPRKRNDEMRLSPYFQDLLSVKSN